MFTSRLPVSTSVRRPKSMAENPNNFANSVKRPSNIPVSVRKANLFTPQTAKRPFSFGNSTGGKSNFMQYGTTTTERKSYISRPTTKPMPDRDQQIKMFDMLVDFLRSSGFPHALPDSKKFFSSVSTTESTRLLEFLIGQIIPDFKISRLEIDVPEALKQLNYPHIRAVTKSALVSVTTRQAVVGLLSIFHWLVLYIDRINSNPDIQSVENTNEAILHCENHLIILHSSPDQFVEKQLELLQKYYPVTDIEQLEDEPDRLDNEIEQIESEKGEIEQLLEIEKVLIDDIDKCQKYHDDMIHYMETKKTDLKEALKQLEEDKHEFEAMQSTLDALVKEIPNDVTNSVAQEVRDKYVLTESRIRDQARKHLESLASRDQDDSNAILNQQQKFEGQINNLDKSIYEKNQLLKHIREKHQNLKLEEDKVVSARTTLINKLRNEKMKNEIDRQKQAETIKQDFITKSDSMMEDIRQKGAYIEELDRISEEKYQATKEAQKRLKRLLNS